MRHLYLLFLQCKPGIFPRLTIIMKTAFNKILALFFSISALGSTAGAAEKEIAFENWKMTVDDTTGAVTLSRGGRVLLDGSVARWSQADGDTLTLADCRKVNVRVSDGADKLGKRRVVTITGKTGTTTATQRVNFYPGKDYVTTELEVSSPGGVASRYMAPVAVTDSYTLFDRTGNNVVFVPYDNDAWVRYRITPFGQQAPESYEVSAIVNADTREGVVVGSLEHDTWKTGVKVATDAGCGIDTLVAYGGIATNLTRDIIPHGKVSGKSVKSPLMMVGRFADWRDGMETFADACAAIAPKIERRGGRPFGWNSWGKLQTKINYDKAMEVADFIGDHLQGNSFENDGVTYIGLDAFWDFGFKPEQHRQFVNHCKARGQKAGIYYCPFTDWGKNPEATVGEMPEYKFKDLYLYGDGKILEFDGAYALDPTHPATQARIRRQIDEFKEWGYEYVKIDFMAHGAYESDKHFDPSVTTGVQAYSRGMQYIDSVADGKLWINLSIAPLFPANYAHSRRIGCDAWADINNTEYTLNALTYGWWLDRVYHYNDADHIVLEGVTDGENRARVTSSAITGVYLLGDDMSKEGDEAVKARIRRNITNPAINRMARECKSFRPIELGSGDRAADSFCYETPECIYVAVFNFADKTVGKHVPLRRIGLSEGRDYAATELWSSDRHNLHGAINVEIPAKDVKVFRIEK